MTLYQFKRYREILFDHGYLAPNAEMFRFYWPDCVDLFDYPGRPRHRRLKYRPAGPHGKGDWFFYERVNIVHDPLPKTHVRGLDALWAFEEALGHPFHEILDLELLLLRPS